MLITPEICPNISFLFSDISERMSAETLVIKLSVQEYSLKLYAFPNCITIKIII